MFGPEGGIPAAVSSPAIADSAAIAQPTETKPCLTTRINYQQKPNIEATTSAEPQRTNQSKDSSLPKTLLDVLRIGGADELSHVKETDARPAKTTPRHAGTAT